MLLPRPYIMRCFSSLEVIRTSALVVRSLSKSFAIWCQAKVGLYEKFSKKSFLQVYTYFTSNLKGGKIGFDIVTGLLSRTNPGIKHIRKILLQLEKTVVPPARPVVEDSDDSSDDEPEVKFENITGAARQAQFTVRLLIDFLPNDILENFR